MDKILNTAMVIAPILFVAFLGFAARKKAVLSLQSVEGLQQLAIKYCLPCLLFNSCLTADVSAESLSTMAMVVPLVLLATLWAFRARKKKYHYHNFPQLFCAKETGMLGIPLFMLLFGSEQAYRMGVLDLAQAALAIPTISVLGLVLNLIGVRALLDGVGIGQIVTACTSFMGEPISAMMLFCVGYNFSLSAQSRKTVFQIAGIHFGIFAAFGILIQLALCLIPDVDPLTRWSVLMYSTLPCSFIAPSLGRTEEEHSMASNVCSILTVVSLLVFCVVAAIVA